MSGGCIAVDLDGTLARYDGWQGPGHIGAPIPAMLDKVRKWIGEGRRVVIFTARLDAGPEESWNMTEKERANYRAYVLFCIRKWLAQNNLPPLEITNVKCKDMEVFLDDRAFRVQFNTGEILDPQFILPYQ